MHSQYVVAYDRAIQGPNEEQGSQIEIVSRPFDDGQWNPPIVVPVSSAGTQWQFFPELAVGPDGTVVLAYYETSGSAATGSRTTAGVFAATATFNGSGYVLAQPILVSTGAAGSTSGFLTALNDGSAPFGDFLSVVARPRPRPETPDIFAAPNRFAAPFYISFSDGAGGIATVGFGPLRP